MDSITTARVLTIVCFVIAVIIFCLYFKKNKVIFSKEYDERQTISRGQAYKAAFFTLSAYNLIYALFDDLIVTWCEPSVGMLIGIFVGCTVFAIVAITKDAYIGLHTQSRNVISISLLVAVMNAIAFVVNCLDGDVIKNGVLSHGAESLAAAICFSVILTVYLIHNKKAKMLDESGESSEES